MISEEPVEDSVKVLSDAAVVGAGSTPTVRLLVPLKPVITNVVPLLAVAVNPVNLMPMPGFKPRSTGSPPPNVRVDAVWSAVIDVSVVLLAETGSVQFERNDASNRSIYVNGESSPLILPATRRTPCLKSAI
jgi:hypothetical protein